MDGFDIRQKTYRHYNMGGDDKNTKKRKFTGENESQDSDWKVRAKTYLRKPHERHGLTNAALTNELMS